MSGLQAELAFEQRSISLFGKPVPQPRLIAWCGSRAYRYSGLTLPPKPVPVCLQAMLRDVCRYSGVQFNHILVNWYRDGSDSMGLHADNEPELGPAPVVCSVSLGHPRRFVLRSRQGNQTLQWELGNGTLFVMGGQCQAEYVHGIPKTRRNVGPRMSLTFRRIVSDALSSVVNLKFTTQI